MMSTETVNSDGKPQDISLQLILARHFGAEARSWSEEKTLDGLHKVTHVRLDRERIVGIDNLLLFGPSVTNVYLQHNQIEKIDSLECLVNLRFLTLAYNKIRSVHGLSGLRFLSFLDLSHNSIADFDTVSLIVLNLKNNPCTSLTNYRPRLLERLPQLRQLDESVISGDVGSDEDDDAVAEEAAAPASDVVLNVRQTSRHILLRSQQHLEDQLVEHRGRLQQLEDIRSSASVTGTGSLSNFTLSRASPAADI